MTCGDVVISRDNSLLIELLPLSFAQTKDWGVNREVRTDNGHEFQAKFHLHVEDMGIRHAYIKPRSPQLNGKVERSHRTDEQDFYAAPLQR